MHPAKGLRYQSCSERTQSCPLLWTDRNFDGRAPIRVLIVLLVLLDRQYPSLIRRHRLLYRFSPRYLGRSTQVHLHPRKVVDRYKVALDGCTLNRDFPHYKPFLGLHSYHKHVCACPRGDSRASRYHSPVESCMISNVVVIRHLIVH